MFLQSRMFILSLSFGLFHLSSQNFKIYLQNIFFQFLFLCFIFFPYDFQAKIVNKFLLQFKLFLVSLFFIFSVCLFKWNVVPCVRNIDVFSLLFLTGRRKGQWNFDKNCLFRRCICRTAGMEDSNRFDNLPRFDDRMQWFGLQNEIY